MGNNSFLLLGWNSLCVFSGRQCVTFVTEKSFVKIACLCKFDAVYQSATFVLLNELPSDFFDGCCCLLNIIIQ